MIIIALVCDSIPQSKLKKNKTMPNLTKPHYNINRIIISSSEMDKKILIWDHNVSFLCCSYFSRYHSLDKTPHLMFESKPEHALFLF